MTTTELLLSALGLLLAIGAGELLADRIKLSAPIVFTLGGLGWALIPGASVVELDPDVVLSIIIPLLLYSAALRTGVRELKTAARSLAWLSIGLVAATALVVALVTKAVLPDVTWPAAIALGAVVAPTDAIAALAVSRRAGMPDRMVTLLSGESLLNDATALTILVVALEAAGGHTVTPLAGVGLFALAALGGALIGLAVALLVIVLRRRLNHPLVENALSLATPIAAYLPAQQLHCSGVLSVVICGLVLGSRSSQLLSGASRLQTTTVWDLITFVLEAFTFLVLGMQFPRVIENLEGSDPTRLALAAVGTVLAVMLVRPVWILPMVLLQRWRLARAPATRGPAAPTWQVLAGVSWAGMRGVVTVAAAFSIPETLGGHPFPARAQIQFLAFTIAAATLLLQGSTFPLILRRLGLEPDRHRTLMSRAQAVHRAVAAGVARLDDLEGLSDPPLRRDIVEQLRRESQSRANAEWERLGQDEASALSPSALYRQLRTQMIAAERRSLLGDRDSGMLSGANFRDLERSLDYEERGRLGE